MEASDNPCTEFQVATILPIRCIPGMGHLQALRKIDQLTINDLLGRIDGNEALLRSLYDLRYLDSYQNYAGFKQSVVNYKKIAEIVGFFHKFIYI